MIKRFLLFCIILSIHFAKIYSENFTINYYHKGEIVDTKIVTPGDCLGTLPNLKLTSCNETICHFAGWIAESDIEKYTTINSTHPTLAKTTDIPTSDLNLYAIFTDNNSENTETWSLVTEKSQLKDQDKIIITSAAQNYAMGKNFNEKQQLAAVKITKSDDKSILYPTDETLVFTAHSTNESYWILSSEKGYICNQQSSNNINFETDATKNWCQWGIVYKNNIPTFTNKQQSEKYSTLWPHLLYINTTETDNVYFECKKDATNNLDIYKLTSTANYIICTEPDPIEYTITLHENNNTTKIKCLSNQSINSFNTTQSYEHWQLYGWSTTQVSQTTTEPEIINFPYTPTEDIDLYAIYSATTSEDLIMKNKTIPASWDVKETINNNTAIAIFKNDYITTPTIENISRIDITMRTNNPDKPYLTIENNTKDLTEQIKNDNSITFKPTITSYLKFKYYATKNNVYISIQNITIHTLPQYTSNPIINEYVTLSFNSNGGDNAKEHYKIKQTKGGDIALPLNSFTNGDKEFVEWNTEADGSGISYNNGDIVKNITQDITLYAQWGMLIDATETENLNETKEIDILKINSNINEQSGQLIIAPEHQLTAQKVIIEKTIDASRYFFFSLPFDCKINDIVATSNKGALTYYDNYTIFYYDQKKAANNKGATGSKAWVEIINTEDTLKANQGYIIGYLTDKGIATIRFNSYIPQTISSPTTKQINIKNYTWHTEGEVESANGWNLIGIPYYQKSVGGLTPELVTIPNKDGITYRQTEYNSDNISPFCSFFVQVDQDQAPTFTANAETAPTAAPALESNKIITKGTIVLTDAQGKSDKTTIINDQSKSEAYEIGNDLIKWIGYGSIPQIYSIQGDDKLAYNALAIDNETIIPIGIYAYTEGYYTFSLDNKSIGELQDWELYDAESDKAISLTNSSYTVALEAGEEENRFMLRIKNKVTTECDCDMSNIVTYKDGGTIHFENLPSESDIYIYDSVGRMIHKTHNIGTTFTYTLSLRGIYNIVIRTEYNIATFKNIY